MAVRALRGVTSAEEDTPVSREAPTVTVKYSHGHTHLAVRAKSYACAHMTPLSFHDAGLADWRRFFIRVDGLALSVRAHGASPVRGDRGLRGLEAVHVRACVCEWQLVLVECERRWVLQHGSADIDARVSVSVTRAC